MRVKTLTLTTASAAALTIGLAAPALALGKAEGLGAAHNQTGFGAHHQGVLHSAAHTATLARGDDDDDEGGDDDGGGDAEIGGFHRSVHHGPRGLCGVGGHIGGFAHGCGEENGDDDDDEGAGGGDFGSQHSSSCCAGGAGAARVRVSRPGVPVVVHRRVAVPVGAVHAGFGGSQDANVPLGIAGLSLLLGGAALLPVARRRLQASARS